MKKGFTLIELLAVILILAIISLIATPKILDVINSAKKKSYETEMSSVEKAADYYYSDILKAETIEDNKETYIPVVDFKDYIENYKAEMASEYVVVKKVDSKLSFYYTGRDDNPYISSKTLKTLVEADTTHIVNNIKVNGVTVNKVIGSKAAKTTIKNWVWYSGQLWQVLETTNNYVKLITANSLTNISYGTTSAWSTSWVRKWLNEIDSNSTQDGIFYNNLSRKDLLLTGNFCLDEVAGLTETSFVISGQTRNKVTSFTPISTCVSIATDKVGLMTFEDYVYSLNGTNPITGALGGSYLDEDELEWTLTRYTTGGVTNKIWHTYYYDPSHMEHDWNGTADYGKSVRAVIYLSSSTLIKNDPASTYGTITNPYRLVGEQTAYKGSFLSGAVVGSYVYLSEANNPYTITSTLVTDNLSYTYDKTKVRYRIIGINSDGSVRVERADILRSLPSTVAVYSTAYMAYYYKANLCDSTASVFTGCINNNYFQPTQGSGEYNYTESENLGYYLNNASNGYYSWLSQETKNRIANSSWNLAVGALGIDYVSSLFNTNYTGVYSSRSNDGLVNANIGLPQWGDMFSGNDLNISYWYINRHTAAATNINATFNVGYTNSVPPSFTTVAVRPVLNLKADTKIVSGEGTPNTPYTLLLE